MKKSSAPRAAPHPDANYSGLRRTMEDRSARIALKGRPLTGRVRMVADGNQVPARGTTRDALSMLSDIDAGA